MSLPILKKITQQSLIKIKIFYKAPLYDTLVRRLLTGGICKQCLVQLLSLSEWGQWKTKMLVRHATLEATNFAKVREQTECTYKDNLRPVKLNLSPLNRTHNHLDSKSFFEKIQK